MGRGQVQLAGEVFAGGPGDQRQSFREMEALFIDDDARNVATATRLGIAGHCYRGLPPLLGELVRRNLVL